MSFLSIRGEMLQCEKCGLTGTIEFEGSAQETQIGDFNVQDQLNLHKMYMEKEYNANELGYYFHNKVICGGCLDSTISELYYVFNTPSAPPFVILISTAENINQQQIIFLDEYIDTFTKKIDKNYCKKINTESYESTIGKKDFAIKRHKFELAKQFVEQNIDSFIDEIVSISEALIQNNEEYRLLHEIIESAIEDSRKFLTGQKKGYCVEIDMDAYVNLNPYIINLDTTVRKRIKPGNEGIFYEGPYEVPVKEISKVIKRFEKPVIDTHKKILKNSSLENKLITQIKKL